MYAAPGRLPPAPNGTTLPIEVVKRGGRLRETLAARAALRWGMFLTNWSHGALVFAGGRKPPEVLIVAPDPREATHCSRMADALVRHAIPDWRSGPQKKGTATIQITTRCNYAGSQARGSEVRAAPQDVVESTPPHRAAVGPHRYRVEGPHSPSPTPKNCSSSHRPIRPTLSLTLRPWEKT